MNILIENCTVLPMTGPEDKPFEGSVGISGDKISMISRRDEGEQHTRRVHQFEKECGDGLRRIDGRGLVAMPGLVNTHNHVSMTLMRGYADDIPLMRWLNEYIWPFEADLTPHAVKIGAQLGIAEMLAGGTTTFMDMYWMQATVAEAVDESGIRAVLCATLTDFNMPVFELDLDRLMSRWMDTPHGRITARVSPHAPYTCSPDTIRRAVELAATYDIGMNIHVSETLDEVQTMRERYGKTSAEYLRDLGCFTRPTLAVHSVHVTDSDIAIFAHNGVAVSHNPQSNMKLASGTAPVVRMLDAGLTVGLGTDGACSNNDLDMWEEMRSAAFLQKLSTGDPLVLPAYQALHMVTVGGAAAIGLDDKIGTLEEGKLADVILVETRRAHMQPCHDLVANLAYCAKASDVATTIVNGEIVAENGRCVNIDLPQVVSEVEKYLAGRKK